MRTFHYSDVISHKFWNIEVSGNAVIVTHGEVGDPGQTQTENLLSPEFAQAEAERLIHERLGMGYLETTPGAVSMPERFERALAENPHDRGVWQVYADYLAEQDQPRGEFMHVQLALEDEARSKPERDALRQREAELRTAHAREWLGELAPLVLDADPIYLDIRRVDAEFSRGWLTGLVCRALSVNEARTFARTPEARLLSRLLIDHAEYEKPGDTPTAGSDGTYQPGPDVPEGIDEYAAPSLHALLRVPHLAYVRVFRYGDGPAMPGDDGERHGFCHANGAVIHEVVARMWRLEELYLYANQVQAAELFALRLPRLSVLRFDHATEYPLETLANNPTLGNLTHLLCHPHAQYPEDPVAYIRLDQLRAVCHSPHLRSLTHLRLRLTDFGDDGVEEVVASGVLKRLRVLDLSYGCVTDRGAALLAGCPDLKHLDYLDLTMNALTDAGVTALKSTGINVTVADQHDEHPDRIEEHGYLEYLGHGDIE